LGKAVLILAIVVGFLYAVAVSAREGPVILPEQRVIYYRDPAYLPHVNVEPSPTPRTVGNPKPETPTWPMSLDEAIRIALENARVIRVLTGLTATSSMQTIYDPAITNTTIDQEQARFDPIVRHNSSFNRTELPAVIENPVDQLRVLLNSERTDEYRADTGISKTNVHGGKWDFAWLETPTRFTPGTGFLLNPQNRDALTLSYTQPLLQGGGSRVNLAPVVIARINTEQSFFQYKASVQELIRGTIEAYWNLVFARTELWARRIQLQQSDEALQREKARVAAAMASRRDLAQASVTYHQFRASLIAAEANVLNREGALRNILGIPPTDDRVIVPTSEPSNRRIAPDWSSLVTLAEERRPDVVELKLILEADQIRLAVAQNNVLPRLDAVALYRWNGLSGDTRTGEHVSSGPGQFTDWTLGLNFSVPLGLRQGRAGVRQQELVIARDRAFLNQSVHAAVHEVALSMRDLDNAYLQYLAYKDTRTFAYENLSVQIGEFSVGRTIYLSVLQALNDWGNSVITEAQALIDYNVALATLEQRTGTILESHGLIFYEERNRAAGPWGVFGPGRCYPYSLPPGGESTQYPGKPNGEPAENYFDLRSPVVRPAAPVVPAPPSP